MQRHMDIQHWKRALAPCLLSLLLSACSTAPKAPVAAPDAASARPAPSPSGSKESSRGLPVLPPAGSGRGGYYQDDGPGDQPPDGLLATPDAEPKVEPYSATGNKPYVVFGKTYTPITDNRPFKQRGVGSWYGKKFHGQKTSSGEPYDMYKMTAAHPTLPIPSYARVTNVATGTQVIVRVNDRGPFHSSRIIDLSYTAALKLGYLGKGSGTLEVERLLPADIERILAAKKNPPEPVNEAAKPAAPASSMAVIQPVSMALREDASLAPTPAAAAPASGFYLQFGAYSQIGNAEAVRFRLAQKWTLSPLEVVENGTFFRLVGGPFATRAEADSAAQRAIEAGVAKPHVVQR